MNTITPTHQSIDQLISFYNNSPHTNHHAIKCQQASLPPPTKKSDVVSEDCYQIDLQQWLSLGQPPAPPAKPEPPAVPVRRSDRGPRPPVPPRRPASSRAALLSAQDPRWRKDARAGEAPIPLDAFRKAMQSLWASLIRPHFPPRRPGSLDLYGPDVKLPGSVVRKVWTRSGLSLEHLAAIWDALDVTKSGGLNYEQFVLGTYQISKMRQQLGLVCEGGKMASSSRSASVCSSSSSSSSSASSLQELPPLLASSPPIRILDRHAPIFFHSPYKF